MSDPLKPEAALLCKLGSLVRHWEEWSDPDSSHHLDKAAIDDLMSQADVQQWFQQMDEMALLPQKR